MEGDYWAKTYGRSAASKKAAQSIDDAESMNIKELLDFLGDAIPKYADEEFSDLQYLLIMARTAANDILTGQKCDSRQDPSKREHPVSPIQLAPAASRG